MLTHPFFTELVAHDDLELAPLLGAGVGERETIHEWPLSWVQKLTLDDGRGLIYKSQLAPTVEAEFYRAATSPLLPSVQVLPRLGGCSTLVVDWIGAPALGSLDLDEARFVEHATQVVEQIGRIEGELPVYYDIGTPAAWHAVVTEALGKLQKLVTTRRFQSITPQQIDAVRAWAASDPVKALIDRGTGLVHSDLRADQIFLTGGDGYRVIDWQRPILAPPEVDLVMLLDQYDIDPLPYTSQAAIGIRWFVILRWAVEAQYDLLPHLDARLFDDWAAGAVRKILGQAPG